MATHCNALLGNALHGLTVTVLAVGIAKQSKSSDISAAAVAVIWNVAWPGMLTNLVF